MNRRIQTSRPENGITRIAHQSAQGVVSFLMAYAEGDQAVTVDALLGLVSRGPARGKQVSKKKPSVDPAPRPPVRAYGLSALRTVAGVQANP